MEQKNNGGPAFPAQEKIDYPSCSVIEYYPGMTLRDYFAAHALAVVACHSPSADACRAYEYADAMLAERAK